jgi:Sugar (and other) transporter
VIGVVPTYHTFGIWASILLTAFRLILGFALGGEWGGAVLMAVEHAPDHRKGFYGSWPQLGAPLGLVLGTLVFSIVSAMMSNTQFIAWGWRLPFPVQHHPGDRRSVGTVHRGRIARIPEDQGNQTMCADPGPYCHPYASKEHPFSHGRALR